MAVFFRWFLGAVLGLATPALHAELPAYTASLDVLSVPVERGGPEASIYHFEYIAELADPITRPVTFIWNGGPGAASVYLHMLALGPRTLDLPGNGEFPAAQTAIVDNPYSWLAFTDLVFVDPVETGFSRAATLPDGTLGDPTPFLSYPADVSVLGSFINSWLTTNNRWASPKVIAGESYGGQRVADLALRLMVDYDITLDKAILISPALADEVTDVDERWSVLAGALLLPTYAASAAAHGLNAVTLAPASAAQADLAGIEDYALSDYLTGLAATGRMTPEERTVFYERVAGITGLDPAFVRLHRGRINQNSFAKELLRDKGLILDRYDASRAYPDPLSDTDAFSDFDPSLNVLGGVIAPVFQGYLSDELDVAFDKRYLFLNIDANIRWDRFEPVGYAQSLGVALSLNEGLEVMVAHGLHDSITPYFKSRYLLEQAILGESARARVSFGTYPGGHMFYLYEESRAEFFADTQRFFAR